MRSKMTLAYLRHGGLLALPEQGDSRGLYVWLNNDIKPISKESIKARCLKLWETEEVKVRYAFDSIPSRICMTCDIFTDASNIEYLCVSVNYVDHNWKLCSKLLNIIQFAEYDASDLANWVQNRLYYWKIMKKVATITLNYETCDNTMRGELSHILSLYDPRLPWKGESLYINCCAPYLDLIPQEIFKAVHDIICKIREGVKYFFREIGMRNKFDKGVKRLSCEFTEGFWMDCPARWDTTYRMLERVLQHQNLIKLVMTDSKDSAWQLSDEDWYKVERVCKILSPLYDLINIFKGNEHPTANLYFMNVWKTALCLLEAMKDGDPQISHLAQKAKAKFDEYWEASNFMLASGIIFDPRYKLRFVKFCYGKLDEENVEKNCTSIKERLDSIFDAYTKARSRSLKSTQPHSEFENWEKEEEVYSKSISELDVYLNEPKWNCQNQFDVLSWWKQNQLRFPVLSLMAIDVLSAPISTFSCDSVFNMGNRLLHRWKASLLPENAEALIATRNWLYGYEVDADEVRELAGVELPLSKLFKDFC